MTTALLERPRIREVFVTPNNGEVTNAELARRLESLHQELHGDLGEISRKMDSFVLREVYQSDQRRRDDQIDALTVQVSAERAQRQADLERIRATVRWWWTAVVVPVGALIVNIWLQSGGG